MTLTHLTDEELIRQLRDRTDLTAIETELLDRLIRTLDALRSLELPHGSDARG